MKKVLLFTIIIYSGISLAAQKPDYKLRFDQIFDNREYFSDYGLPQTIFGAALDANLVFEIDSTHEIVTGINYLYEHGSSLLEIPPRLNLYYHYDKNALQMYFGVVSRKYLLDMPLSFLNDTLNYYRPNIEGSLISYSGNLGYIKGFVDWTGRLAENRRERFLIGIDSKIHAGGLFLRGMFLMYHNARGISNLGSFKLQDNGIMSAMAGYSVDDGSFPFDIEASLGILSSYNRIRPGDFVWGKGVISGLDLTYGIFGIKGAYYFGDPIDFAYGDPFYRSGNYGRIDLFADPFKSSKIDSKLGWNFHFVKGEGIHNSQQILISVAF
ncbi:MAG: hypothetical protein K9J30_06540 [Bacteroidales bacterium]|nr:hypothetical protein [Bacteroidales bacterium]